MAILLIPTQIVSRVLDLQCLFADHKRVKSINHHRQFMSSLLAYTFLYSAGVRPMWYTDRVQGDHTSLDMLSAHEVSIHIVQHLITVYIAVEIWRRDSLRVVIIFTWYETAYHEIPCFKCLMYRRWHMYPACDRLEIMYRENERIVAPVPSHCIKGMVGIVIWVKHIITLDINQEIPLFIMRSQVLRTSDVALAEWRML